MLGERGKTPARTRRLRGFSLIEIAVVLVIITILAVMVGSSSIGLLEARRRDETNQNLQKVEAALINFVATARRLPCPANGALAPTDPLAGAEPASCSAATMTNGVVPWRALGLTQQEVADGWLNLFTYRVAEGLTTLEAMKMSDCDPAGGDDSGTAASCNTSCTAATLASACTTPRKFLLSKGLSVQNAAGVLLADPNATPPTGAAYVLISAGPTQGPAYNLNGQLVNSTATLGTQEAMNGNNRALNVPPSYYVDSDLVADNTLAHFDDIVRRPTILTVITRANLGPRAHN